MNDTIHALRLYEYEQYQHSLRLLGESAAGRLVLAEIFASANCLNSISDKSADIYRKVGVRDFALRLWHDLHAANPAASTAIFDKLMTPIQQEEMEYDTDE